MPTSTLLDAAPVGILIDMRIHSLQLVDDLFRGVLNPLTLVILWDDYDDLSTWNEITAGGAFTTHNPALSVQHANGFPVHGLIAGYLSSDAASLGQATPLVWMNPGFVDLQDVA